MSRELRGNAVAAGIDAIKAPRATLSEQSDEELACRAQAGSLPSFVELVSRFESRLFNFVLRRITPASDADAEDLVQETFVRAWSRMHQYRSGPGRRFSTWIFTIAANLAADHQRARKRERNHQPEIARRQTELAEQSPAAVDVDRAADGAAVWELAAQVLNEHQHAAVWLRYAEDLSIADIARVLGKTQIGVRVTLHRARAVLMNAVEKSKMIANDSGRGSETS